ncbi:MAG: hypothetical protein RIE56_01960 [Amphiplicatus sp.]
MTAIAMILRLCAILLLAGAVAGMLTLGKASSGPASPPGGALAAKACLFPLL